MRKKLSITQIIISCISALLPMIDGMFVWTVYTMDIYTMPQNLSKSNMSLNNLMTVQKIGGGPFLYWLFNIAFILIIVYCVCEIFFEEKTKNIEKKKLISIPAAMTFLGTIMIITSSNHTDTFKWNGQTRHVAVSMGILAYIELALLISLVVIEFYKQYKCE